MILGGYLGSLGGPWGVFGVSRQGVVPPEATPPIPPPPPPGKRGRRNSVGSLDSTIEVSGHAPGAHKPRPPSVKSRP